MKAILYINPVLLCILCAFVLGSCSDAVIETAEQWDEKSISFSATEGWESAKAYVPDAAASRVAANGTFEAGDQLGIFAYYLPVGSGMATAVPDFMYNQPLTLTSAAGWTYSPVKCWPSEGSLSFFAYYPYNAAGLTLLSNSRTGYPVFDYTADGKTDLLVANPLLDQTYETTHGTVKFHMSHALTKVEIYVKSTDNVVAKTVTAFSVSAAKRATLTCRAPLDKDDIGFGWTYPSPAIMINFDAATNLTVPGNSNAKRLLLCSFYLLPKGENNTFDITYTYAGANGQETVALKNQPLPALDKWQPGASMVYTVGIDNKVGASVTGEMHPAWGDGGSETVDGEIVK